MIINSYLYGSYDLDALSFFNAAGITDATQKSAYNTLVLGLKANSLYTKFQALYPMLGGTATSHKFNAINPLDTDAAFRLVFSGGWTHSSTGALPNGTNGTADTRFKPSVNTASINSYHISYYSGTNNTFSAVDMGGATAAIIDLEIYYLGSIYGGLMRGTYMSATAPSNTSGLFVNSRIASNSAMLYRNTTSLQTSTTAPTTLCTDFIALGARADGFYSNRQCRLATIGTGLTASEIVTFSGLVSTYQTTLGR